MKRLLIVIPRSKGGGAELQSKLLAEHFNTYSKKICVEVLYVLESDKKGFIGLRKMYQPKVFFSLRKYIQQNNFDFVYSFLVASNIMCSLSLIGLKSIHIVRESSNLLNAKRRGVKEIIRRLVINKNTLIIANSLEGKAYWRDNGYTNSCFVPNFIENFKISKSSSISYEKSFVSIGRMVKSKNAELILDVFLNFFPYTNLTFVGDGPIYNKIKSKESKYIKVFEFSEKNEIYALNNSLYFISASEFEGMPNAVLKAAIQGKELILSDIPAHRNLFNSEEVHYHQNTIESLKNILDGIIKNKDHKKIKQDTLTKFDPKTLTHQYEKTILR